MTASVDTTGRFVTWVSSSFFHLFVGLLVCLLLTKTCLWDVILKTLDTFGNWQRPVFSLAVSQHLHKITNLWKFELNWISKLRDVNGRTSKMNSKVSKSNPWKSSKTTFLQSRFSHCFILSTALHCLLPSKVFMLTYIMFLLLWHCTCKAC